MAANIQEAIDDLIDDMAGKTGTPAIFNAAMAVWVNQMFTADTFPAPGTFWAPGSAGNRTVYDWAVPNIKGQQRFLDIFASGVSIGLDVFAQAIVLVLRTLTAVQQATIRGDITADQETSVVNAYNAAWN